jgi:UDP-N-acetylmuramoylalanine--D-glutamate ligase
MKTPWSDSEWRRALVYGLGVSGRAAARLLRDRGVEVVGVDGRAAEELELGGLASDPGVELLLGADPEKLPAAVDGVVVSPGVPRERPLLAAARRAGVPVVAEVELAFPFLNGPVIGVTGSNGKSTTTALTGSVLRSAGHDVEVCGNIGVPLSACVEGAEGRVFVVELSSFQLESIDTFRPRAAALLNLSADHLDRHAGLDGYLTAKRAIFGRQREGDVAVLNADDRHLAELPVKARRREFSRLEAVRDGCFVEGDRVVETAPGEPRRELFRRDDLGLPGTHNLENAMAAALLARALGAEPTAIRAGLAGFRGLPHRLEVVAELDDVIWFDDSKGTNLGATLKSLEGFADGTVHLILGGRGKGADPAVLAPAVKRKARRVYLIGESAAELERLLAADVPCERSGDLERAVAAAARHAGAGESVLLSPAYASFDQYGGFAERGDHFKRLVNGLAEARDG